MSMPTENGSAAVGSSVSSLEGLTDAELCAAGLPPAVWYAEVIRRAHAQAVAEIVAEYPDLLMLVAPCR
jgi:hypothetical protein